MTANTPFEWQLSFASPAEYDLDTVKVVPYGLLAKYVTLDLKALTLSFSGYHGSAQLVNKFLKIDIEVVRKLDLQRDVYI